MTIAARLEERGKQFGLQQGLEKGRMEGRMEGKLEGEMTLLERLIKAKFGVLPDYYLQRLKKVDQETLLAYPEKILKAETLEQVFEGQETAH